MSTTRSASSRTRHRVSPGSRRQDDAAEEHTPEYAAVLRALLRSAIALIDVLKSGTTDPVSLDQVVTRYVAQALNAGISRARIRDALELIVREHGGVRWSGVATAIGSLAMCVALGSAGGAPHSS